MELYFYYVMCRSILTVNRMMIPATAVGKIKVFLIAAEGGTNERFYSFFKYNLEYIKNSLEK